MGRTRLQTLVPTDLPEAPRWARAAQDAWGLCGVALCEEELPVVRLLVGPALHLPGDHPLGRFALHASSAQLVALQGSPDEVAVRQLVQHLARHLVGRVPSMQAAASAPGSTARCDQAPPLELLQAAGFCSVEEFHAEGLHRVELALDRTVIGVGWQRARAMVEGLLPGRVAPPEPSTRHLPPTP